MGAEMSAEWKDYIELKNERPELFAEGRQFQIILDEKTVRDYCDKSSRKIGLLYRSPYTMLLVDLVTDPEGNVFPYERIIPCAPKNAVVVVPMLNDKYVLLRQFRHSMRKEQYAFPRGYGEPDLTVEENAAKEISEELGAEVLSLSLLGKIAPDSGILSSEVNAVICTVDKIEEKKDYEGILETVLLSEDEISEWIKNGKIVDGYTLASMSLLWSKR